MVHRSPSLSRSQRNQREQKENRRIHIGQALLLPSPPDPPSSCSCYSDTIFTLDGSRLVNPRRIEATPPQGISLITMQIFPIYMKASFSFVAHSLSSADSRLTCFPLRPPQTDAHWQDGELSFPLSIHCCSLADQPAAIGRLN